MTGYYWCNTFLCRLRTLLFVLSFICSSSVLLNPKNIHEKKPLHKRW